MGRNPKNRPVRDTVALVGDGQTERIYFGDVRDVYRPTSLTIQPDYPRKLGSYKGVLDRATALKNDSFNHVFALIDMDKIIQENRTTEYQHAKATAERAGVIILENNPCFEIWLLLHFVHTGRLFSNCSDVVTELRKHIPDYTKGEKFLNSTGLYRNYKKQLAETAIANAKKLEIDRAAQDALYPRAETFRFFEWYFALQGIVKKLPGI